jgi:hypothetical protein
MENRLETLEALVARQQSQIDRLEDRGAIERLQYAYGYFLDNRMFDEVADLFTDDAPWIEIGQRGRYRGKHRIRTFLLEVLGKGRWGLLENEVINHVQMQPVITVAFDGMTASARARAQVQGNSPPTTECFLLADGVYENEYVKEDGVWKIKGLGVAMTYYALLQREKIWFDSAPPSDRFPPDSPSRPADPGLGRQFSAWHFLHPVTGESLKIPASANAETRP